MDSINIFVDSEVYECIRGQLRSHNDTENAVLRRILTLDDTQASPHESTRKKGENHEFPRVRTEATSHRVPQNHLRAVLTTPRYFSARQKDKYLLVLAAVAEDVGSDKFMELKDFQFGSRPYFASKRSGGDQELDEIPGTELLALTSLGGPRKARILRKVLSYFGYSESDIDAATSDYPAAVKRKSSK